MEKEEALLLNRIFSRNGQIRFRWGQGEYRLSFLAIERPYTPEVGLLAGVSDGTFWVGLEKALFMNQLKGLLDEAEISDLPDEMRSAALEAVLEELLDRFDSWIGAKSAVREFTFDASTMQDLGNNLSFTLTHTGDNQTVFGHFSFDRASLEWLANVLERVPLVPTLNVGLLPVQVTFEIGKVRLPLGDFQGLGKDDLILCDECFYGDTRPVLVRISPNLLFKSTLEGTTVTLGEMMEETMADERKGHEPEQEDQGRKIEASSLDEVMIDLVFELGEKKIPLKDLMTLQPGHTFDLERNLEKPVGIRANGKIVGFGELVQVNDHIGVRVLDLFGREHD